MPPLSSQLDIIPKVEALRLALLPPTFSPTGQYSNQDEVDIKTDAYIVLCHAEFEHHLEEIARLMMEDAVVSWEREIATPAAMALLALNHSPERALKDYSKKDKTKKSLYSSLSLQFLLNKVASDHDRVIKNNNGIRAEDLKKLFDPLGIPLTEIDPVLVFSLDDFGKKRGTVAHGSFAARQGKDPAVVYGETSTIATRLHELTLTLDKPRAVQHLAAIAFSLN